MDTLVKKDLYQKEKKIFITTCNNLLDFTLYELDKREINILPERLKKMTRIIEDVWAVFLRNFEYDIEEGDSLQELIKVKYFLAKKVMNLYLLVKLKIIFL